MGQTSNLYFGVGGVNGVLKKKATKEEITEVCYLHVDVDCRAGETLGSERRRIMQLLADPKDVPKPTLVIDSGGGFWGFWKLNAPLNGDSTTETADEHARYNRQLELIFGGDNCFDISRIARLPGSINWPNKQKRDKGRTPERATVVEWHEDRVYPIERFVKSDPAKRLIPSGVLNVENVKYLDTVDDLPETVSAYVKALIVQGTDLDDPNKFPSRSEAVWFVTSALVEAQVPDDVIYAVLTDSSFKISESVLENMSSTRDYAARQIGRAKENVLIKDQQISEILKVANTPTKALFYPIAPVTPSPEIGVDTALKIPSTAEEWIDWMNRKHAVIGNMGGKCRVIEEVYHRQLKRTLLSSQAVYDFQQRYQHIKVTIPSPTVRGRNLELPLGAFWIDHCRRRYFDRMEFCPQDDAPPNIYNMWKGFGVVAAPGDCGLLVTHIFENVCNKNEECFEYLLNWFARGVQFPWLPGYTAVVLRGAMGAGKGVVINAYGHLFGRHYMSITDTRHLVGNFNMHLQDCCVLFADEAFYAGDKKNESSLKALITEPTLTIEGKGLQVVSSPNNLHILMASNSDWVVPVSMEDRRFFVLDVSSAKRNNSTYFAAILNQLSDGGSGAFLDMLMKRDISKFDVTRIPQTEALRQQKIHSLSPVAQWWYQKLIDGRIFLHNDKWERTVSFDQLKQDFFEFVQTMRIHAPITLQGFMYTLMKIFGGPNSVRKYQTTKSIEVMTTTGLKIIPRPYMIDIPDLVNCRELWDRYIGCTTEWQDFSLPSYEQYVIPEME